MGSDPLLSLDLLLAFLISFLILLGFVEMARLRHALSGIPIRIHVNGIRGKSSVTRLIAAGLRGGGIKTIGKTTGTYPRIILEDGKEIPIKRRGMANIREQIGVIWMARTRGAQVLVLECNAIRPELQWVSEHRIFRSTLGVITNVRRDHVDALGDSLEEIAGSLSNTIPHRGTLVIGEKKCLPFFEEKASSLETKTIFVEATGVDEIPEQWPNLLFPENIQLSLRVCEYLGVGRDVALRAMGEALPDPGALQMMDLFLEGKEIRFVNAFSANDPDSLDSILAYLGGHSILKGPLYAILNNRRDRVSRALEFARFIATKGRFKKIFITGDLTWLTRREALRHGAKPTELTILRSKRPDEIMKQISKVLLDSSATLIGIGNFGGLGEKIVTYMERIQR